MGEQAPGLLEIISQRTSWRSLLERREGLLRPESIKRYKKQPLDWKKPRFSEGIQKKNKPFLSVAKKAALKSKSRYSWEGEGESSQGGCKTI